MTEVRAAGGIVTRVNDRGELEVLVVHRSRQNDWSFPKGKLDEGETFEEAALREVTEETGLICRAIEELASVRYRDASDRPKLVRYWRMVPVEGDVADYVLNHEIDDLRWVPSAVAQGLLSYQHDRDMLTGLEAGPR